MKLIASLLALAGAASAHYTFPALFSGGTTTGDWQYVRDWTGSYTYNPVQDVTSLDIRCNVDGSTNTADTLSVPSDSPLGFTVSPDIYHLGRCWYTWRRCLPDKPLQLLMEADRFGSRYTRMGRDVSVPSSPGQQIVSVLHVFVSSKSSLLTIVDRKSVV